MNSDHFEQSKQKAQLRRKEQEFSKKIESRSNDVEQNKAQTSTLEKRNNELEGNFKSYLDKPTEDKRPQFEKDTQEHKKNTSQIQKLKQELPAKQQKLDEAVKERGQLENKQLEKQGLDKSYKGHAVSPNATGTKKGDVKREYHQAQPNARQPNAPDVPDAKDTKDMNWQNKQPNSQLTQQAKDKAKENQAKPKEQQQTQSKQNEQDNER